MKSCIFSIALTTMCLVGQESIGQQLVSGFEMPTPIAAAKISTMQVCPDGKIVVAGAIDLGNGAPKKSLARLNSDGSLDGTLDFKFKKEFIELGLLSTGEIIAVDKDSLYKISPSGNVIKRIKTGSFYTVDIEVSGDKVFFVAYIVGLRKYDSDLVLDPTFKNDNDFGGGGTYSMALQGSNILVGGTFNTVNGIAQNDIARFDSGGNFDNTFVTGAGTPEIIFGLAVQGDGKVLLTKSYINSFNGTFFHGLARLNPNGSIDPGFFPPPFNGITYEVIPQGTKILVSTFFYDGTTYENRLIRLNADGEWDVTFPITTDVVSEMQLTAGNEILTNTSNTGQNRSVIKYSPNGAVVSNFNPNLERIGSFNNAERHGDFIFVTGDFNRLNDHVTFQTGKMNLMGAVDPNFVVTPQVAYTINGPPTAVKIRADNEIFLGLGSKIIKLDGAGAPVPGFQTPVGVQRTNNSFPDPYYALQFEILANGNIITAGPNGVYQLDTSGAQVPGLGADQNGNGSPFAFDIQGSKIIYGGVFTQLNSQPANRLVRLNLDGTIDNTFNIGTGPSAAPSLIKTLPNGSLIVKTGTLDGYSSNLGLFAVGTDGGVDQVFRANANTIAPPTAVFLDGVVHNGSFLLTYFSSGYRVKKIEFNGTLSSNFAIDSDVLIKYPTGSLFLSPRSIGENMFILLGDFEILSTHKSTKGVLLIENQIPVISAATTTFETLEDTPIQMSIGDFSVSDSDNTYPGDFTLTVLAGTNYSVSGNEVTPTQNFYGTLSVAVRVNDGHHVSPLFYASVEVTPVNDVPVVRGTFIIVSTPEDTAIELTLSDFVIADPDNSFPDDFGLIVSSGSNYTLNGNVVTPDNEFNGNLTVPIIVGDLNHLSDVFYLNIEVIPVNDLPVILGTVSPFSTLEDTAIELTLSDFNVDDIDNTFPNGFTLIMLSGDNYTVFGDEIIPNPDFFGTLSVPIMVNDGNDDSPIIYFNVEVTPVNDPPGVLGTTSSLIFILEDTEIELALSDFEVFDPDSSYPNDFTLTVMSGDHYVVSGNVVTPTANFYGTLSVPVQLNDGYDNSEIFYVSIDIFPINDAPVVTGVPSITTPEETPIVLSPSAFTVTDPDNTFPTDFTVVVSSGGPYTVVGNQITPAPDLNGTLSVPVMINDGQDNSQLVYVSIEVTPVNDAPVVTGVVAPLSTPEETAIDLSLSQLTVTDVDNTFPNGFTLTPSGGNHYTLVGNKITPETDFNGTLTVRLIVNDGAANSANYDLSIAVTAVNDPPVVHSVISTFDARNGQSLKLAVSDFEVIDPDNAYPGDFSLIIEPGAHYTVGAGAITPDEDFTGDLTVSIKVNDGHQSSPSFGFVTNVQLVTALVDSGGQTYRLIPNPTQGVFQLVVPAEAAKGAVVSILDITGKPVAHYSIRPGEINLSHELDLSYFSTGIYLVKVELADGKRVTRKLVLAR